MAFGMWINSCSVSQCQFHGLKRSSNVTVRDAKFIFNLILLDTFRYPTTEGNVQTYKSIAERYMSALSIPQTCSEQVEGTNGDLTDYLYKEYNTPMLTAKVSCCEYPAIANIPYIWRDILAPIMSVLESTLTGEVMFQITVF